MISQLQKGQNKIPVFSFKFRISLEGKSCTFCEMAPIKQTKNPKTNESACREILLGNVCVTVGDLKTFCYTSSLEQRLSFLAMLWTSLIEQIASIVRVILITFVHSRFIDWLMPAKRGLLFSAVFFIRMGRYFKYLYLRVSPIQCNIYLLLLSFLCILKYYFRIFWHSQYISYYVL